MTGRELIEKLNNLTEEQKNYPVGYYQYRNYGPKRFIFNEYNDVKIDGNIIDGYSIGIYINGEVKK